MRFFIMLALTIFGFQQRLHAKPLPTDQIHLPDGFTLTVVTDNVPGAREMALGDDGRLYVGTRTQGRVYEVQLNRTRTKAESVRILFDNLVLPNGVAYKDGKLFIAEVNRILRVDDPSAKKPSYQVVYDKFPKEMHHGWKYIAFGPDGYLYVPVGAPCNVCLRKNRIFATVTRMKVDGSPPEIIAEGVRNSVGFAWHPVDKTLWFTDNGRDWLGDDVPPDELNHVTKAGEHFGFPYYYADNLPDPDYGELAPRRRYQKPVQKLGPHVAALGMLFYTGKQFPNRYHHQIFIAEHGSWNRSKKIGYRVSLVTLKNNQATSYEVFAKGWLQKENVWGRPVALLQMPDGSVFLSDDYAGAIYRIAYNGKAK